MTCPRPTTLDSTTLHFSVKGFSPPLSSPQDICHPNPRICQHEAEKLAASVLTPWNFHNRTDVNIPDHVESIKEWGHSQEMIIQSFVYFIAWKNQLPNSDVFSQ